MLLDSQPSAGVVGSLVGCLGFDVHKSAKRSVDTTQARFSFIQFSHVRDRSVLLLHSSTSRRAEIRKNEKTG